LFFKIYLRNELFPSQPRSPAPANQIVNPIHHGDFGIALVVPEIKFVSIPLQMLRRYAMMRAVVCSFENRPPAFYRIR